MAHYFSNQPNFFEEKILPLIKQDGIVMIAMPGLKEEIRGSKPQLIQEWLKGEESEYFRLGVDKYLACIGMVIKKR